MYKLLKNLRNEVNAVLLLENSTIIPMVEDNADYQQYLKWLDGYEQVGKDWVKTSKGNTPEPADIPAEG